MIKFSINLAKNVELILEMSLQFFPRKICIKEKFKAIKTAKKTNNQTNLTLWYNGSKLDQRKTKAIVI